MTHPSPLECGHLVCDLDALYERALSECPKRRFGGPLYHTAEERLAAFLVERLAGIVTDTHAYVAALTLEAAGRDIDPCVRAMATPALEAALQQKLQEA